MATYRAVHTPDGKFACLIRENPDGSQTTCAPTDQEFLAWASKETSPPSIADKEPEALPRDVEREAIAAILARADADITAAEFKTVTLRLARRVLAKGL